MKLRKKRKWSKYYLNNIHNCHGLPNNGYLFSTSSNVNLQRDFLFKAIPTFISQKGKRSYHNNGTSCKNVCLFVFLFISVDNQSRIDGFKQTKQKQKIKTLKYQNRP